MELFFFLIYMLGFWGVKFFLSDNIYVLLSLDKKFIDLILMFSIGFFVVAVRKFFYSRELREAGSFDYVIDKVLMNYFWHALAASLGVYYVVFISHDNYFDGGVREFGFSVYVFCLTLILFQLIELCVGKFKKGV
ncbi:hypothetical protein [uncultured Endozoicomonas sp.]|uniref:hypothetical protein n=1 Tax=uncultured Endozoicomonas sp. TaxID=432652 RepID=UPI002613592C|nr:hypothetical protein [uncultured Endozoicomonas sp.]